MTFYDRLKEPGTIIFDGAMGTQIQNLHPSEEEWDGKIGCTEVINLTLTDKVQKIHEDYLAAGADVIETNTFGANEIVLAEYDLQDRVIEINRIAAQIARKAAEKFCREKQRFVAGSMGPGTKLITLGQTTFDNMYKSYANQARGLVEGGVDLLVIETCQDPLQIKTCVIAVQDVLAEKSIKLPIVVSVTVETTGSLLVGTEISAILTILQPFDIAVLGMNCATGPAHMRPYIKQICQQFDGPVICQPNAGLPRNIDGRMVYTLPVQEFVNTLAEFVAEDGVKIVGGCCGTTPEFISALHKRVRNITVAKRNPASVPAVASLFSAQTLKQDPAPFYVGERANTNGSKIFREFLLQNDWDGVLSVAREQQKSGAHSLDLCVAYTGRDEAADMHEAVRRVVTQVDLPLFIDSTDTRVIEEALKLYGGRPVINSINLEDGEGRADKICQLAKRYGAALIALTIDEKGMALEVSKKIEIAKRIYDIAVNRHGLKAHDLIFDALTFTLGSGDDSLKDSGKKTLAGIRQIKETLPGVLTILGLSNISFGLAPHSREILNSVFLAEALNCGLDLAIVNVSKIQPLYQIDAVDREKCLNLIYNRGKESPLFDFIAYFEKKAGKSKAPIFEEAISLEEKIKNRVIEGNKHGLDNLLTQALEKHTALDIINEILIPGMKIVGDLFGSGKMQLPFVLQSAEVMKFAVDKLEPFMEKSETKTQTSIVLATVRGDVHDIGKNLVDIILSNNGFKVYNLGIKCEIDTMLQKLEEVNASAIGMSGLLVKSTVVMKDNLEEMKRRGIKIPVLLGGAALTRSYVEDVCAPIVSEPVIYCADAFDGLNVMNLIKDNSLQQFIQEREKAKPQKTPRRAPAPAKEEEISRDVNIPTPPFWGDKVVNEIDLDDVFPFLTESVLFRGRWGYRRGQASKEEFEALIENTVRPEFEEMKEYCKEKSLLIPQIAYGYYSCNGDGEDVIIYKNGSDQERLRFHFPRQKKPPYRCIADFFLSKESGRKDVIAVQVVTVGMNAQKEAKRLYENDEYKKYLLFHGLSVETAEALAEYWHQKVREELKITGEDGAGIDDFVMQKYRGSRYSFGYPACPDLAENRKIFELLLPERIGVYITDEEQMVPEQTTSAFIVHHPQAKYFTIE